MNNRIGTFGHTVFLKILLHKGELEAKVEDLIPQSVLVRLDKEITVAMELTIFVTFLMREAAAAEREVREETHLTELVALAELADWAEMPRQARLRAETLMAQA